MTHISSSQNIEESVVSYLIFGWCRNANTKTTRSKRSYKLAGGVTAKNQSTCSCVFFHRSTQSCLCLLTQFIYLMKDDYLDFGSIIDLRERMFNTARFIWIVLFVVISHHILHVSDRRTNIFRRGNVFEYGLNYKSVVISSIPRRYFDMIIRANHVNFDCTSRWCRKYSLIDF